MSITGIATNKIPIRQMPKKVYVKAKVGKLVHHLARLLATAGACLYLFTIGLIQKKHRPLLREVEVLIGTRCFTRQYVPPVEITSLAADRVSLCLCEQAGVFGNIQFFELLVLVELIQTSKPMACFEIGTFDGRTTLNMAANTPEETLIYTLDLPRDQMGRTVFPLDPLDLDVLDKEMSGVRYRGTAWENKVQQLYGDSANFDYTPYQGKIDFVFIDGSHTYEYVLSDSRNAITLLRGGKGIILWHDYTTWPEVRKAVNYLRATDPRFANTRYIKDTSFACLICE